MIRHPASCRRPGNVLLWFALTVWVLMALAALVVDLGMARAEHRRMQTLSDQAALDAARGDDPVVDEEGPVVTLTGGIPIGPEFNASQKLDIETEPLYLPVEVEQANETTVSVRLRRRVPLPFLFARGAGLKSSSPLNAGIAVRAESTAAAWPVLCAGPVSIPHDHPGVAPFGLLFSSTDSLPTWQAWRQANPLKTTLTVQVDAATGEISGDVVGSYIARPEGVTVVGQPFPPPKPPMALLSLDRFIPLYVRVADQDRVVGFLHSSPAPERVGTTLTIPLSTAVAIKNATTALTEPLPAGLTPAEVTALFAFTTSGGTDPLRAPALVR